MKETILEGVKECIVEAVGVSITEISPTSQIVNDLGADSLDLVELIYLLETKFAISLQRGAVMERIRGIMKEDEFIDDDGFITPAGIEVVRREVPELASVNFADKTTLNMIIAYFTVEVFVSLIEKALENRDSSKESN